MICAVFGFHRRTCDSSSSCIGLGNDSHERSRHCICVFFFSFSLLSLLFFSSSVSQQGWHSWLKRVLPILKRTYGTTGQREPLSSNRQKLQFYVCIRAYFCFLSRLVLGSFHCIGVDMIERRAVILFTTVMIWCIWLKRVLLYLLDVFFHVCFFEQSGCNYDVAVWAVFLVSLLLLLWLPAVFSTRLDFLRSFLLKTRVISPGLDLLTFFCLTGSHKDYLWTRHLGPGSDPSTLYDEFTLLNVMWNVICVDWMSMIMYIMMLDSGGHETLSTISMKTTRTELGYDGICPSSPLHKQ